MSEVHIQTSQLQLVPGLLGGFIFVLGLCSLIVKERLYLSETLLAMAFGIAIGPYALNWVDPSQWSSNEKGLSQEFSRFALAIKVMIAGVTLPKKYLMREWRSMTMLLLPVMSIMWLVASSIVKFTFSMSFIQALAIGACMAPTDLVLANAILKGIFAESHIPRHLRNVLTAESGANDGLGYPLLFFSLYLMRLPGGKAIGTWVYASWGYHILLSVAIGVVSGFIARKALRHAETAGWVDKESVLSSSITLALLLVGICTIIGTDSILCCFIAGNSFTWDDWFRVETKDKGLQETLNGLLSMSFFIYFGTIIPWSSYTSENMLDPWRIAVAIILIMCLRRLPTIVLLYKLIPAIHTWQEALFAGWFGPIGVSAIFYSVETIKQLEKNEHSNGGRLSEIVYPIVCAIVFGSVLVHGITIPLVLMGKRVKTTLSASASTIWRHSTRVSIGSMSARRRSRKNGRSDSQSFMPEISAVSTAEKGGLPFYETDTHELDNVSRNNFEIQRTAVVDDNTDRRKPDSCPNTRSLATEIAFHDTLDDDDNGLYIVKHDSEIPSPERVVIAG
ncbi:hypothetical protein IW140_002600 [Coemansia sp. RSA 1813]|nr:hypothetical protein EV178_002072 [Coemansia sp. RSA 1646]KAJ1772701.1 hypothetical protein LPJ74_001227 [Coemansia sp. RSA 1843]KAJ2090652.1 hypothetical protein IW138_002466 [Coemansia sp. RSA 986]KAJ2216144.1 hypothetical protein EV179_001604 [Coemansia sp. RSA 487]KAJ2570130.1 hypothetical protein IW140_002600 [Coemansia sp. RSA 1813]